MFPLTYSLRSPDTVIVNMRLGNIVCVFLFLCRLPCFLAESATDSEGRVLKSLINVTGGRETFVSNLTNIAQYASSLRGNESAARITDDLACGQEGAHGWVTRVEFDDEISWAAKFTASNSISSLNRGYIALEILQKYCPNLPIPRIHGNLQRLGGSNTSAFCLLTDWIEGESLWDEINVTPNSWWLRKNLGPNGKQGMRTPLNIRIPDEVVPQLAQFIFNLTTCNIPTTACLSPTSVS